MKAAIWVTGSGVLERAAGRPITHNHLNICELDLNMSTHGWWKWKEIEIDPLLTRDDALVVAVGHLNEAKKQVYVHAQERVAEIDAVLQNLLALEGPEDEDEPSTF